MKIIQSQPKTLKFPVLSANPSVSSVTSDFGFRPLNPNRVENAPMGNNEKPLLIYERNGFAFVCKGWDETKNSLIMIQIGTLSHEGEIS